MLLRKLSIFYYRLLIADFQLPHSSDYRLQIGASNRSFQISVTHKQAVRQTKQAGRQNRQAGRQARQASKLESRQIDRQACRLAANRQAGRQTNRQEARQSDRLTGGRKDKLTDVEKQKYTHLSKKSMFALNGIRAVYCSAI
jgi:hypothetical protein